MFLVRKLYDWTLEKSKHPKATWFLSIISFAESSFFPIPPDIILIPMIISNRIKAWYYAFICTLSSVFGGIFGYLIGSFFYSTIALHNMYQPLIPREASSVSVLAEKSSMSPTSRMFPTTVCHCTTEWPSRVIDSP